MIPGQHNKSSNEILLPTPRVTHPLLADLRSGRARPVDQVFSAVLSGYQWGRGGSFGIVTKTIGCHLILHDLRHRLQSIAEATGLTEYQQKAERRGHGGIG